VPTNYFTDLNQDYTSILNPLIETHWKHDVI